MEKRRIGLLSTIVLVTVAVVACVLLALLVAIIYPLWRLFAWAVNVIGVKGARVKDGKLQTPIITYAHPHSNSKIVFVSMIHVGEAQYFEQVRDKIDSLTGYTVQYEKLKPLTGDEEAKLTAREEAVVDQVQAFMQLTMNLVGLMSLRHQRDALVPGQNWKNADMSLYDFVRTFASENLTFFKSNKRIETLGNDEAGKAAHRWFIDVLFKRLPAIGVLIRILGMLSRNRRRALNIILEKRNDIAVRAILSDAQHGNVCTIWGGMHLNGIERKLKDAGFREVHREWLTTYHIRNYRLIREFMLARQSDATQRSAVPAKDA